MELRKLPKKQNIHWGELIGKYAEFCYYQTIVEIGVQRGTTTKYLCQAAKINNGKVYGYDWFAPIGTYSKNNVSTIEQVNEKLKDDGFSSEYFKLTKVNTLESEFKSILNADTGGKIDMAFIDGDHSYNGIKNDFLTVYPLLIPDGSIILHDTYSHVGCRKFILDLYTDLNDGTFDMINLPFGNGNKRYGLTILIKRSFPISGCGIKNATHDPDITIESVLEAEQEWFKKQMGNN